MVLSLKTWNRVWLGLWGGTWPHREACIDAKQSHEELVVVGCLDLKLDDFAPGIKWCSQNI